jgi:hypothetical protein
MNDDGCLAANENNILAVGDQPQHSEMFDALMYNRAFSPMKDQYGIVGDSEDKEEKERKESVIDKIFKSE